MAYPHAHIAAILSFFVLPGVASVVFLLTPFSRRRKVLPWILVPLIYIAVAFVAVIVAVNLGFLEP